jgi:hypothetical protein
MKTISLIFCILISSFAAHAQCCKTARAAALWAISQDDPAEALTMAHACEKDSPLVVFDIYTLSGGEPEWPYVYKVFTTAKEPFNLSEKFGDMVAHIKNEQYAQQGIEALTKLGKSDTAYADKITAILLLIRRNRLQ